MTTSLLEIWPEEIRAEVRSPSSILTEVAESLTARTRGLLRGEIHRAPGKQGQVALVFDIVVPALEDYRQRVLRLAYDEASVYPVLVDADAVNPTPMELLQLKNSFAAFLGPRRPKPPNQADSDTELISIIQKVVQSIVAQVQSLIARANDVLKAKERLREIDDLVANTGYRYDSATGELAATDSTKGTNCPGQTGDAFLSMLPAVTRDEWHAWLNWKKEQAQDEIDQQEVDRLVEKCE